MNNQKEYIYLTKTKQVAILVEKRPSGYRLSNIGIVPYSEARPATESEINAHLNSHKINKH